MQSRVTRGISAGALVGSCLWLSSLVISGDTLAAALVADAGGPYVAYVGIDFTADASGSTGTIAEYQWDWGDGTNSIGAAATHAYSAEGNFSIQLTVADDTGQTAIDTAAITVYADDTRPLANPGGPYAASAASPITFDASGSLSLVGIAEYQWDFGVQGATASGVAPSYSFARQGTYNVTLRVIDINGVASPDATTSAVIQPVPPVADGGGPYVAYAKVEMVLDGSASYDSDGSIAGFNWDTGDGGNGDTAVFAHTYKQAGEYTAILTVTDDEGFTASASAAVTVRQASPVADPGGPYELTAGTEVLLNGAASFDPDGTITAYAWDTGDGGTGNTQTLLHLYAQAGEYTVTLTVTDNDGQTGTTATAALVHQAVPAADAGGPYLAESPGQVLHFDGSASHDLDGVIVEYRWDFGDATGFISPQPFADHAYAAEADYTVTLQVMDNDGLTATATGTAVVRAGYRLPVADAAGPYVAYTGIARALDGTRSTGAAISHSWDFGDGGTGSGVAPTHVYTQTGEYTIALTVTDDAGLSAHDTTQIKVSDYTGLPLANPGGPYDGEIMVPVQFDGTGSLTYGNVSIRNYDWSFGVNNDKSARAQPKYSYQQAGTYTVTLYVIDNNFRRSLAATTTVTVRPAAPFVDTGGPYAALAGEPIAFDASQSYDPDGTVLSYDWAFGDGTGASTPIYTHAYAAAGDYSVALTLTDNDGLSSTATTQALVSPAPPTADAGGPYAGETGTPLAFDGAGSVDVDGVIDNYTWDFGDGSTAKSSLPQVEHVYVQDDIFTVTLTVRDNDGLLGTDTTTATIVLAGQPVAEPGGPYTGRAGVPVIFNGAGSSDPDGEPLEYRWDFGDGKQGTGEEIAHTYASQGQYTVLLTVIDPNTLSHSASTTVLIDRSAPVAATGGPYTAYTFDTVVFDAANSIDYDGTITRYDWSFGDGAQATGAEATHVYTVPGNYVVALEVIDNEGLIGRAETVATVAAAPVIARPGGPYLAAVGEPLILDGSGSTALQGAIASYSWDFGDGKGAASTLPTYAHVYSASATHIVRLTATDESGNTDTELTQVTVELRPQAEAGGPYEGVARQPVDFDGSASNDNGTLVSFAWDFGDGTTVATEAQTSHAYERSGSYSAALTVTDDIGLSATDTAQVTIANAQPTADPGGPYIAIVNEKVTLDASGSSDPDGYVASVVWDFGDGSVTASIGNPAHTYTAAGSYTATLTVTDDEGATATASTNVTVREPPTADPGGPYAGFAGVDLVLDGSGSYHPTGHIIGYSWDLGDGGTGHGAVVTHRYAAAGTYTVTLTVTDDANRTMVAQTEAVIARSPPVAHAGGPYAVLIGNAVNLDGSASFDPDGTIVSHQWDLGDPNDATPRSGVMVSHLYSATGHYTVRLSLVDNDGLAATDETTVAVQVRPVADPGGPYYGSAGIKVVFDGSASHDSDGTLVRYRWDFGDGSAGQNGITVTYTYAAAGYYTATLRVTDNDGLDHSAAAVVRIAEDAGAPFANAGGPYTAAAGRSIVLDASRSFSALGPLADYAWDLGDGTVASGPTPSVSWAAPGTYNVVLTVTDIAGIQDTATATATVLGLPQDGLGYRMVDSLSPVGPTFAYEDLRASALAQSVVLADDESFGIPLPFDFNFYGRHYQAGQLLYIVSNGYLDFDGSTANFNDPGFPIPHPGDQTTHAGVWGVPPLIAPWLDDLNPAGQFPIYYETRGTPGQRRMIIQYHVPHVGTAGDLLDFQVLLFEGSDQILFQYQATQTSNPETSNGRSATVGIQGSDVVGMNYAANESRLTPGLAVLFLPPQGAFVGLTPSTQIASPGDVARHSVEVANFTGADGEFAITLLPGHRWTATAPQTSGLIADGATGRFTVEVDVPSVGGLPPSADYLVVQVTGNGHSAMTSLLTRASAIRQLTDATIGTSKDPAISADAGRIVFTSTANLTDQNPGYRSQLFTANADGTGLLQLTNNIESTRVVAAPTLSADGMLVAFQSNADLTGANIDGGFEIFSIQSDGTGLAQLTSGTRDSTAPTVSGDGMVRVFASRADLVPGENTDGSSEIFVLRADGTLAQLTHSLFDSAAPSLSRNGSTLAFESKGDLAQGLGTLANQDNSYEIFIIRTDGSGLAQVTNGLLDSRAPQLSADGSTIVFTSKARLTPNNTDGSIEVFVVRTDGSGLRQITNTPESSGPATISADGRRIALQSRADLTAYNADGNSEIFVARLGAAIELSQVTHSFLHPSDSARIAADGSRLVFTSTADLAGGNADASREVFVLDLALLDAILDTDDDGVPDTMEGRDARDPLIAAGVPLPNGETATLSVAHGERLSATAARAVVQAPSEGDFGLGVLSYRVASPVGGSVTAALRFSRVLTAPIELYRVDTGDRFVRLPLESWEQTAATEIALTLQDGGALDQDGVADGWIVTAIAMGTGTPPPAPDPEEPPPAQDTTPPPAEGPAAPSPTTTPPQSSGGALQPGWLLILLLFAAAQYHRTRRHGA